jgi:hypothetical protein
MSFLAGSMAEARFANRRSCRLEYTDRAIVELLVSLHSAGLSENGKRAYLANLKVKTKEILKILWPKIEAVAAALTERRELSGEEVDEICEKPPEAEQ